MLQERRVTHSAWAKPGAVILALLLGTLIVPPTAAASDRPSLPTAAAPHLASLPTAAAPNHPQAPTTGIALPWAAGGKRIDTEGNLVDGPEPWPDFPIASVRLWDTRTAWLHLEPADDQWNWTTLDAHVALAQAKGVQDITLVLAGTPRWAAQRTSADDAPWLGPGSASPPRDLAEWQEFITTVVSRYAGRISTYEIGNEPNLTWFWNGTPAEYAQLVTVAASAIRQADPAATVVVDGGLLRSQQDLPALRTWLGPVAGNPDIDAVSIHVYPQSWARSRVDRLLQAASRELDALGFADLPRWITEVNLLGGARLSDADQRTFVAQFPQQAAQAGFEHVSWYAWTELGPEHLIPFGPRTPAAQALRAATP